MAVVDTSLLIDLEKDVPAAWGVLEAVSTRSERLRLPAAVWVEYLSPMVMDARETATTELSAATTFEPFTRELADEAALLQKQLFEIGQPLGWHDLQVAATARWHHEAVLTRDAQFARVPGLRVVAW